MPRIPDIVPEKLSPDQKKVYDNIVSGPRGQVAGPLRVWLSSPELAERSQALGAFCRFHSAIPPRLSELAIIITGHFWRAGYEWATHAPIGIKAGLDPAKVELLRTGQNPNFDKEDEAAVYAFCTELLHKRRVSQPTFERAHKLFGEKGVVDLTGICGYYSHICCTINAFEVLVPEGTPDPLPV